MRVKRLFCRHDYQYERRQEAGITLGWAGDLVTAFDLTYKCAKCGKEHVKAGMYFPHYPSPQLRLSDEG